ncbi:MAG: hypothetical protein QOH36_653 [Actinomycetota bacterium]|nr:hypothetical protein [Actinomycetota bacterium]
MDEVQKARYDRVFDSYKGPDGDLTWDSFSAHIAALAALRGEPADSPAVNTLREGLRVWWDQLCMVADTDHDGRVSRDEWGAFSVGITDVVRQTAAAGGEYPLTPWIQALYGLIDADGDGRITQEEYGNWLTVLGLAESTDIPAAFAGFDTDENGTLSWEEFAKASEQYWSDFENPSLPGARWIGP